MGKGCWYPFLGITAIETTLVTPMGTTDQVSAAGSKEAGLG